MTAGNRPAGGNGSTEEDVRVALRVPLKAAGIDGRGRYTVTPLWPRGEAAAKTEAELKNLTCVIRKDRGPGGGVTVFRIEPA